MAHVEHQIRESQSSSAEKSLSERTMVSSVKEKRSSSEPSAVTVVMEPERQSEEERKESRFYAKYRPFILTALALVILGWWISSIVLKATRHRWCVMINHPLFVY